MKKPKWQQVSHPKETLPAQGSTEKSSYMHIRDISQLLENSSAMPLPDLKNKKSMKESYW
jgi:hypothetical protein